MGARLAGFVAVVVLTIAAVPPGFAGPSAGGFASDNVTYLATIPFETGAGLTGARVVGRYLYASGPRSLSIYDVSDALDPQLESITPMGPVFPNEDVDTNGKILLIANQQVGRRLEVWDVEDKSAPVRLATMENLGDHTFTCVLGCRYAYGAGGSIIDLRNPARPRYAGMWGPVGAGDGFDTTEVAPGLVMTASRPIRLLDARKDPLRPTVIAQATHPDNRLMHSLRWPNRARDRFFLVQGETFLETRCAPDSGALMTWDATDYKKTGTFHMIDEFRASNGTFADGSPPANGLGCTAMWFQEHPRFRNGGLVATAYFEHGTRFLEVNRRGKISERGYFLPAGGETIATYWITDEIVYAIDMTRGIDILRFDR